MEKEIEQLIARYDTVKMQTHSFEARREIRGKIREFKIEIEFFKKEIDKLRF